MGSNFLKCDAIGYTVSDLKHFDDDQQLESVLEILTLNDYRSIFFLLMDLNYPIEYLYLIKNDKSYLKNKFREFNVLRHHMIEALGIMKKNKLLRIFGSCQHIFSSKDIETVGEVKFLWKCLYIVCEQLTDHDVHHLKHKYLPNVANVECAEELIYHCYLLFKKNLQELASIFKDYKPQCCYIINSIQDRLAFDFYPVRTPTKESPCGYAFIFAHVNFHSDIHNSAFLESIPENKIEAYNLKELWESFGFQTKVCFDCTDEEVVQMYKAIAVDKDVSKHDVFVACHLSHGEKDVVYSSNCKKIQVAYLVNIIANECVSLLGKPKLFFIQACQGNLIQQGVGSPVISLSYEDKCVERFTSSANVSLFLDVLLCFSSIEGFVSFRPSGKCSWFMEAFIDVLKEYGEDQTISAIMTKVINLVSKKEGPMSNATKCKQTPVYSSTLKRELKLRKIICSCETVSE